MIYGVFPSLKQEKMNTWGEKDGDFTFNFLSKFRNIKNYIGTFVTSKCIRINIY